MKAYNFEAKLYTFIQCFHLHLRAKWNLIAFINPWSLGSGHSPILYPHSAPLALAIQHLDLGAMPHVLGGGQCPMLFSRTAPASTNLTSSTHKKLPVGLLNAPKLSYGLVKLLLDFLSLSHLFYLATYFSCVRSSD